MTSAARPTLRVTQIHVPPPIEGRPLHPHIAVLPTFDSSAKWSDEASRYEWHRSVQPHSSFNDT